MRQAAIEFATLVDKAWQQGQRWDAFFCTDMLNVAEFKGLLQSDASKIPILLYFHENQFVYPNRVDDPRDFHFPFTNFTSALAADHVWFNSEFNRDSMLQELLVVAEKWPSYSPVEAIEVIKGKSHIQPPGADLTVLPDPNFESSGPVHVVWASRWEHDKNPNRLLEILRDLKSRNVEFALSVLGESYSNVPDTFPAIQTEFADQIINWGYQETRQSYFEAIAAGDVFLSTADHEFFGIAAIEGMAAGLIPILPNGLAYPEVLQSLSSGLSLDYLSDCLYNSVADAALKIVNAASRSSEQRRQLSDAVRARYSADVRAREMDQAICNLIETQCKSF